MESLDMVHARVRCTLVAKETKTAQVAKNVCLRTMVAYGPLVC
jgi:hypothetical protein